MKPQIDVVEAPNPNFQKGHEESSGNPLNILVQKNMSGDPMSYYQSLGRIDKAQYECGLWIHKLYYEAEGSATQGVDMSRENVDGGKIAFDGITERKQRAFAALTRIQEAVGPDLYFLLVTVCGRGVFLHDLYKAEYERKRKMEDLILAVDIAMSAR